MNLGKKLPPDVEVDGVFTTNELDLREVKVYGFDYDYTLACYKESVDHLIYNLGRDTLVHKLKYTAYNSLIRTAKKIHFTNALRHNSKNLKKTWGLLNEALNKSKSHSPIHSLLINQTLTTDPTEIANAFNTFFTTIAEQTASQIPPVTDPEPPLPPSAVLTFTHHLSLKKKFSAASNHWKTKEHQT